MAPALCRGIFLGKRNMDAIQQTVAEPTASHETAEIAPEHLEMLGEALASRRDRWVQARTASGVERRWLEDLEQYLGVDAANKPTVMMDVVQAGGYPARNGEEPKPQRSTVYVNITRPKTNAAEARLANMLFPVDDKNWGIRPTPNPKLSEAAEQEAQVQAQQSQDPNAHPAAIALQFPAPTAAALLALATNKSKAMEVKIEDALNECDYNSQGRLMLHDCAVLGTGILKGPIVVNRVSKAWMPIAQSGTHVLQIVEQTAPASERVDPWNVYPDPACGDDIHNGIGIFEKKTYTGKQLRDLAKQPGYLKRQIAKVLEKGPQQPQFENERDRRDRTKHHEPLFEVWEYWGEFTPEDMRSCEIDCPDGSVESISGCVIFVGDVVIKGFLNPIETGDVPFDFMVWERVDNSPFGYGVPYTMRPAQRVLNAAWRQMMDNAGLSVGPNVVLKPDVVQPADKNWTITGRKLWNCLDPSIDVRTAFSIFEIPNNTKQFEEIIQLAMRFADEESAVPTIAQGEQGGAPETVGGMQLLMNSANVVLTRMVKHFDDMITRRHIRRYYDYFMAYDPDPAIKGDFQVDARGSSALLVRDMQQQAILQFGQFQGSPVIAPMVRWQGWIKEVLKSQHIDPNLLLKTDAEIAAIQSQPPQPSPEEIKAQAVVQSALIRADAAMKTAQARNVGELAYAEAEARMAENNAMARMEEIKLKRELALLEYANKRELTLEQVKADLAKTAMQEETKRQLAAAEAQLAANENDKDRMIQAAQPPKQPAQ